MSARQSWLCVVTVAWLGSGSAQTQAASSELAIPPASGKQSIVYVGKTTTTDFRGPGMGQHLQYFPAFGLTRFESGLRTDSNRVELTPDFAGFEHHVLLNIARRTFSPDAGGNPIGVKTAGGDPAWAVFTLPDGRVGRSGTTYDEAACAKANNFVNQIRINTGTLHAFCLNLITDNTNRRFDPDVRLEARSDKADLSLEGHPDLSFDGQTDMYTFRFMGMQKGDRIKIRIEDLDTRVCEGAGLGGIMVSNIETCTPAADTLTHADAEAVVTAGDSLSSSSDDSVAGSAREAR